MVAAGAFFVRIESNRTAAAAAAGFCRYQAAAPSRRDPDTRSAQPAAREMGSRAGRLGFRIEFGRAASRGLFCRKRAAGPRRRDLDTRSRQLLVHEMGSRAAGPGSRTSAARASRIG